MNGPANADSAVAASAAVDQTGALIRAFCWGLAAVCFWAAYSRSRKG